MLLKKKHFVNNLKNDKLGYTHNIMKLLPHLVEKQESLGDDILESINNTLKVFVANPGLEVGMLITLLRRVDEGYAFYSSKGTVIYNDTIELLKPLVLPPEDGKDDLVLNRLDYYDILVRLHKSVWKEFKGNGVDFNKTLSTIKDRFDEPFVPKDISYGLRMLILDYLVFLGVIQSGIIDCMDYIRISEY